MQVNKLVRPTHADFEEKKNFQARFEPNVEGVSYYKGHDHGNEDGGKKFNQKIFVGVS
jgi:hypothetical protein